MYVGHLEWLCVHECDDCDRYCRMDALAGYDDRAGEGCRQAAGRQSSRSSQADRGGGAGQAQAARRAANARAEKLLLANLNPEQREDLVKKNCFFLHLPNGKRYRIDRKTHGNIALIGEGDKIIHTLCAQPPGIPVDDAILAQKLALETDEAGFLRVANMTRW